MAGSIRHARWTRERGRRASAAQGPGRPDHAGGLFVRAAAGSEVLSSVAVSAREPWLERRGTTIAVIAILVVAVWLRLRDAIATPLWFDEIYSLWVARGGLREALRLTAADVHPPLHALMLVAWRRIGGEGHLWLAAFPLAFSLAGIVVWLGFARDLFGAHRGSGVAPEAARRGTATALLSTALLAIHPFHVHLSHELRWFSVFWFFSTLAAWTAWRWHRGGHARDAVLFVVSATAMIYTHYLGGVLLIVIALWGLGSARRDGARLVRWLVLLGIVAVAFAPQLPIFLAQMNRERQHWIPAATPGELWDLLRKFSMNMSYLAPFLLALAVLPLARARTRAAAAYLWLLAGVPIAATWIATAAGAHLFTARYMTYALPFWCGLVAAGVMSLTRAWARIAVAAVVLVLGVRAMWLTRPNVEPVSLALAAQHLRTVAAPTDTVFCGDTHSLLFLRQHMPHFGYDVLLLTDGPLPYYEGTAVVPGTWVVRPADLRQTAASSRPWWGVITRKAGPDTGPTRALFDSLSCCPPDSFGIVTLWRGGRATAGTPPARP